MHPYHSVHDALNRTAEARDGEHPEPSSARDAKAPSRRTPEDIQSEQRAMDLVDEACMESFPCSDPPSYTRCHC